MTEAIKNIIAKLDEVFAPFDAKLLTDSQIWAKGRKAAVTEFKNSEEAATMMKQKNGVWAYYDRVHAIAGGKTWYNVFEGRNDAMIAEFVTKNCAAIAAKRNANIASKLEKVEVTEIVNEEFAHSNDGFNGFFGVMTNKGKKVVSIRTIYAGGYNIQCAHMRVLIKVR